MRLAMDLAAMNAMMEEGSELDAEDSTEVREMGEQLSSSVR